MVSWRSGFSSVYLIVLTHRVIGSSPVLCVFFINHLSCFYICFIHFYKLFISITYYFWYNLFIVLYFFSVVIFTFEINSYHAIKFQKLNSACATASLDQRVHLSLCRLSRTRKNQNRLGRVRSSYVS